METEDETKARLVKMVATTQLRLALEAEDERSAKKWNDSDLIWIEILEFSKILRNVLARPVMGTIFLVSLIPRHCTIVYNENIRLLAKFYLNIASPTMPAQT